MSFRSKIIALIFGITHFSALAIVDEDGCAVRLSTQAPIKGFFTDRPQVGHIVVLFQKAYVVERAFKGGGGTGHGPHDYYPDVPMFEVRRLSRQLTYDRSLTTRTLALNTAWYRGNASSFYVVGKITFGYAPDQVYNPDRKPALIELSREIYQTPPVKFRIGSVVLLPDLNGRYVIVNIEDRSIWVAQLDPLTGAYADKAEVRRINEVPLAVIGFLKILRNGAKPAFYNSWNDFKTVFEVEEPQN